MLFEVIALIIVYIRWGIFDFALWGHHILGLFLFTPGVITKQLHGIIAMASIAEVSAPFTAISWMLTKTGFRESTPWFINQVLLLLVWVFIRQLEDIRHTFYIVQCSDVFNQLNWYGPTLATVLGV
jgi:hypothetical protein